MVQWYCYDGVSEKGDYREINEDSFTICAREIQGKQAALLVLCDGVGGTEQGAFASGFTTYTLTQWFEKVETVQGLQPSFCEACQEINDHIVRTCQAKKITAAATLSAVLAVEQTVYLFHLGDSRIYKQDKAFSQCTSDDTCIEPREINGQVRNKSVLVKYMGTRDVLRIWTQELHLEEDTAFLVCSDGFYKTMQYVQTADFLRSIQHSEQIKPVLQTMLKRAYECAERDNATVAVLKVFVEDNTISR